MKKIQKIDDLTLAQLSESVAKNLSASKSDATKRAYRADWTRYTEWCEQHSLCPLPAEPETVTLYTTWMAESGLKVATIVRALATLSKAHKISGVQSPTGHPLVVENLRGIKRRYGTDQKKAKPLTVEQLKKISLRMRPTFIGRRDKALLQIGWAAALRRSEIVSLDFDDIEIVDEGIKIKIRSSKTDQEGKGYMVGIPWGRDPRFCPAAALETWINLACIKNGPLFFKVGKFGRGWFTHVEDHERLSPRSVNQILVKRMRQSKMRTEGYSGHSLRSGFITSAAAAQIPEYTIQLHTRHKSVETLRGYIREAKLFSENSLSILI